MTEERKSSRDNCSRGGASTFRTRPLCTREALRTCDARIASSGACLGLSGPQQDSLVWYVLSEDNKSMCNKDLIVWV